MAPRAPFARLLPLGLAFCASCASAARVREFPSQNAIWQLDDRRPYSTPPQKEYSPFVWDALDYSLFKPIAEVWRLKTSRPALDVNAFDEVPNSSWFTNRMSTRILPPAEAALGACSDSQDLPHAPWTVIAGKPDGSNPGFIIEDARGKKALIKTDGTLQPERASTADTLGALLFHAAGYFVPCNRVLFIRKEDLKVKPGAQIEWTRGKIEPLSDDVIARVLSTALEVRPGVYRVSASEFIAGKPLGPWRYEGTRSDDPNDAIEHQHRRSNRGMRILASWIDHVDTRQENTMLGWIKTSPDAGYVLHYRLDFSDSLGQISGPPGIAQRLGHTGYLDFGQAVADFATLGAVDHPWHDARFGKAGPALGYFAAEDFDPEYWEPGYPNPAFDEAQEQDWAWMARIVARFSPQHLEAMLERARIQNQIVRDEILRILQERRRRLLERYLTRLSPLTWPEVKDRSVHLEDLLISTGLRQAENRVYSACIFLKGHAAARKLEVFPLPQGPRVILPDSWPPSTTYGVLVLQGSTLQGSEETDEFPLWIHFRFQGERVELAGIERPQHKEPPAWP
jgi:hypothetical protein